MKIQFIVPLYIACIFLFCTSCWTPETEIQLEAPAYNKQLVAECYIEEGKPFKLLLSSLLLVNDKVTLPFVNGAKVYISYNGKTDTLKPAFVVDTLANKFYNYTSTGLVNTGYKGAFMLSAQSLIMGANVQSITSFPDSIQLDTLYYRYAGNERYYLIMSIKADSLLKDYFRVVVNVNKDSLYFPKLDIQVTDRFANKGKVTFFSTPRYKLNDTVHVAIYRINKEYYDFERSARGAFQANINPFSQPQKVVSNIQGGTGIFTAIRGYKTKLVIQ
ncbi:MAG: DUF4249 family protein [Bacteroidota bacterium]|nr:DUF4249 family protein [Bacteroidota bacterium]